MLGILGQETEVPEMARTLIKKLFMDLIPGENPESGLYPYFETLRAKTHWLTDSLGHI